LRSLPDEKDDPSFKIVISGINLYRLCIFELRFAVIEIAEAVDRIGSA
jgi:hypothetical protein